MTADISSPKTESTTIVSLLDCSGELLKDAVHSAVIEPINSILQMGGKAELHVLAPDEQAKGMKAAARQAGEMAGTIFDFMILRKATGSLVGGQAAESQAASLIIKTSSMNTARQMSANVLAGLGQGYLFMPMENGNAGLFSAERLKQGTVSAVSMLVMDSTAGLSKVVPGLRNAPQSSLMTLGRSLLAGTTTSLSQVELADKLKRGHWASGAELGSATAGGALSTIFFHSSGAVMRGLSTTIQGKSFAAEPSAIQIKTDAATSAPASAKSRSAFLETAKSEGTRPETARDQDKLLETAQLHLSPKTRDHSPRSVISGYVLDEVGRVKPVVIRYARRPDEVMAHQFHQLTDFDTAMPKTVHRDETAWGPHPEKSQYGIDVQERVGKSIDDRLRNSKVVVSDPQLRDQMEQATAERLIIGDDDGHEGNMTVSRKRGKWTVGNIDFSDDNGDQGTFNSRTVPQPARNFLNGQNISQPTLDKIKSTLDRLETAEGRERLESIGLTGKRLDGLLTRARVLLEHKRFPNYPDELVSAPGLSSATKRKMATDREQEVRAAVAKDPHVEHDLLVTLADDASVAVRSTVAQNPVATPDLLQALADDDHTYVRASVAKNPQLKPTLFFQLAEDPQSTVRKHLAANPSLPQSLLHQLAADQSAEVREGAASRASAPHDLLARLAEDKSSLVRVKVANNPATPQPLLAKLAEDPMPIVRIEVASNPATNQTLLSKLADDPEYPVRKGVAQNPAADSDLLGRLAKDEQPLVRLALANRPKLDSNIFEILAGDEDVKVKTAVARNQAAGSDLLARLARDEDPALREVVAANPAAGVDAFKILINDNHLYVRRNLAGNRSMIRDMLLPLASDRRMDVISKLFQNPVFWQFEKPS